MDALPHKFHDAGDWARVHQLRRLGPADDETPTSHGVIADSTSLMERPKGTF